MTFHDRVHADMETEAYKSAKHLLLWLKTIAGVDQPLSMELEINLEDLATFMCWPLEQDEYVGTLIK